MLTVSLQIRKIRCDTEENGCLPCRQSGHSCRTTDRVSGHAVVRGHKEKIEKENRQLADKVSRLEQILKDHGIPVPDLSKALSGPSSAGAQSNGHNEYTSYTDHEGLASGAASGSPTGPSVVIPIITNPPQVQVAPGLKMLAGQKLGFFGLEMDGINFDNAFSHDDKSPQSYQGMLTITAEYHAGRYQLNALLPPTKQEAKRLASFYFLAIHPYCPILDRGDMDVLVRGLVWATYAELTLAAG